jgi:hypothetical protein
MESGLSMQKRALIEAVWDGVEIKWIEHAAWNAETALRALESLDGIRLTQLEFDFCSSRLMIVGGHDDTFNVIITVDVDRELYTLCSPDKANVDTIELVIGEQRGIYPASQIVSKDIALAAICHFHATGQPAPELHWLRV